MTKHLIIAAGLMTIMTGAVLASTEDETTSLSYISYLERYATVQSATQEENIEAVINMPLVAGDRIDSAREARVEVYLADGSLLWLDEYTSVSLDAVALSRDTRSDRTVLFLSEGRLMLEIPATAAVTQASRVDGARGTVYLNRPGLYRVEAIADGDLWVETWEGLAEAASSAGGVLVRPEQGATITGGAVQASHSELTADDDFALWVAERRRGVAGGSAEHVDEPYQRQASQLDSYGNWVYVDGYDSWAWRPTVDTGWRPYSAGRWYWTPTGWAWISYEPWGWLPYHYGSWWWDEGYGWLWSWHPYWSPAWVDWMYWPGHVGWCPSGYYDYWWWHDYGYDFGWHDWSDYGGHHHGNDHGTDGGGAPRPGHRRVDIGLAQPIKPSRVTLNLNGRVNLREVDPRGWSVAPVGDFSSPQLSRLVRPGETALRDAGDLRAVVSSAPLMTPRSPQDRLGGELERVLGRADTGRDLGPVLSRNPNLEPETAIGTVDAEPVERASRRATPANPLRLDGSGQERPEVGRAGETRRQVPNVFRSTLPANDESWRLQPERRSPTGRSETPTARGERTPQTGSSSSPSRGEGRVTPRTEPRSGSGSSATPRSGSGSSATQRTEPRSDGGSSVTPRSSGSTSPSASGTTHRSSGSTSLNRWESGMLQPRSGSSPSTRRPSASSTYRSAPAPRSSASPTYRSAPAPRASVSPTIRPPSGSSSWTRPSTVRPSSPSSSSSARSYSPRSSSSSSSSHSSPSSSRSSGSSSSHSSSSSSHSSGSSSSHSSSSSSSSGTRHH